MRQKPKIEAIERLVVSVDAARAMLGGCSRAAVYEILPQLKSYMDGRARRITVESIKRYIAGRVATATGEKRRAPLNPYQKAAAEAQP